MDSAPQAVSTGEAVTPFGDVFGAVDMDQISDFLTGAKYADNARSIIQIGKKGMPGITDEEVSKAKRVLASFEYHDCYRRYNREPAKTKQTSTKNEGGGIITRSFTVNFFKAVQELIMDDAQKGNGGKKHGDLLELSKALLNKWIGDFEGLEGVIVDYNLYRDWVKAVADPETKAEKKENMKRNIQKFIGLMDEYKNALQKIPKDYEPKTGFWPDEWKQFQGREVTKKIRALLNPKKPLQNNSGNGGAPPHHENNGRVNGNQGSKTINNHFYGYRPRTRAGINLDNDWAEAFSTGMPMEGGEYPLVSTGSAAPAFGSSLASGKNQGNMKTSASRFCQCGPDCVPVPIHTGVDSAAAGAVSGIVPRKPLAQQAPVKTASKDGDFCKCKDPWVETGDLIDALRKANAIQGMRHKQRVPRMNSYRYSHGKSGRRNRYGPWAHSEYSDGTPLLF